jgi:hypothetical protein
MTHTTRTPQQDSGSVSQCNAFHAAI